MKHIRISIGKRRQKVETEGNKCSDSYHNDRVSTNIENKSHCQRKQEDIRYCFSEFIEVFSSVFAQVKRSS